MIDAASTYDFLSLLPPLIAIGLALITRQIILSLLAGLWFGFVIIAGGNALLGTQGLIDALVGVFASPYNTRIVLFTLIVGALIALTQASGGVEGFTRRLLGWLERSSAGASKRGQRIRAELLALATGMVLFIESNISILTVGTLYRPVFDKLEIPREKLAYITDSGSAPSCILFPFNAWGAHIAGLIAAQGIDNSFGVMLSSIAFNFYPMLVVLGLIFVIISGKDVGEMKRAEMRAAESGALLKDGAKPMMGSEATQVSPVDGATPRARNMLIPIALMVALMPTFLIYTGWEKAQEKGGGVLKALQSGSGDASVLYAVIAACAAALVLYKAQGLMRVRDMVDLSLRAMGGMIPMALLMVLAFALGSLCKELATGAYVADQVSGLITPALLPAIVFLVACFIAFSTGTSWGTFTIMIAIAVPLAQSMDGANVTLAIAASIGGGIFGDHCSPTSDTSIISSMATANDHIDHVRTQLPYALIAGALTVLLYLILGFAMA